MAMNMQKICGILCCAVMFRLCEALPPDMMSAPEPNFSSPIMNITVPVGREGVLTCVVHDLISYKVAWLRVDTQTILTIANHIITKNPRISVTHTENRIWQLRIRDITQSDQGWYMCQINTDPMKSALGYLAVVVPPDIIDYRTSHDMTIDEGQNITLKCTADGLPEPTIEWRREGKKPLMTIEHEQVFTTKGPTLFIRHANRHQHGAYLCIASNGVPPTVSKRIKLNVNFPPSIITRQDIVYAAFGQKVLLECVSESHPDSANYWLHGMESIQGGTYDTLIVDGINRVTMKLIIRPKSSHDFGAYKCVARNALGETEKVIYVKHKSKLNDVVDHSTENRFLDDNWGAVYHSRASISTSTTVLHTIVIVSVISFWTSL